MKCVISVFTIIFSSACVLNAYPARESWIVNEETTRPVWHNQNKIEPLGFSKVGLFAYVHRIVSGDDRVVVRDLVNDQDVKIESVAALQPNYDLELGRLLKRYGIIHSPLEVMSFPLRFENNSFDVVVTSSVITPKDYGLEVTKHEVIIRSDKLGKKTVGNFTLESGGVDEVAGFIKSPFERRIAIVISTHRATIESTIIHDNEILGSSLVDGFQR